ncbi:hypothetical protein [Sorangium sp. So ce1389]|uniref:hypothetical protein n=1 Tax=Sorangium sp. So ce1389 TaxID=3133336 RepID=UPI003F63D507
MIEIEPNPSYVVSMSGIHGAGKATLAEWLCKEYGLREIPTKVFALGRMLDAEGLETVRANALEQNRLVLAEGAPARSATSRLGLLDVALYASAMASFGRIDPAFVEQMVATVTGDMSHGYAFPQVLIGMACRAEALQERLMARDAEKGLKASRGLKRLEQMYDIVVGIYRDAQYPNACVAGVVEHYRRRERLLFLDTSDLGIEAVRERAGAFLRERGLL